ncbi:hypothetical protein FHH43_05550 [Clostridium perfringens]|nr:hypothetical protein [Clostridium perfringens]
MISKNKIIALILGVSLASSATYGSYAYFKGEYSVENTIKIVNLDSKESSFEVSKISTRDNSLVLEFSKKVFYSGNNMNNDIIGSGTFLDNVEISIDGNELIITKKDGAFLIPVGIENDLPSIKLNNNFEDRFGKDLRETTLYLYEDSNGSISWSLTNEHKGDEVIQPNNEIRDESSIENSNNNESENIEGPKVEENNKPLEENVLPEENSLEQEKGNEENKEVLDEKENLDNISDSNGEKISEVN